MSLSVWVSNRCSPSWVLHTRMPFFDKPFHHKGRFVSDTPDAVKHEHSRISNLPCLARSLMIWSLSRFSARTLCRIRRPPVLREQSSSPSFHRSGGTSALHGDVGLAFIVIVHLLVGGHSIQTVNASSDKNVIFHIDPSFSFVIRGKPKRANQYAGDMNFSRYIGLPPLLLSSDWGGLQGCRRGYAWRHCWQKEDSKICFTWPRAVVFLLSAKVADI